MHAKRVQTPRTRRVGRATCCRACPQCPDTCYDACMCRSISHLIPRRGYARVPHHRHRRQSTGVSTTDSSVSCVFCTWRRYEPEYGTGNNMPRSNADDGQSGNGNDTPVPVPTAVANQLIVTKYIVGRLQAAPSRLQRCVCVCVCVHAPRRIRPMYAVNVCG